MTEEALEGETRKRDEAETRLGVATEVLERAADEAEWKEVKDALRTVEEGERSKFQQLMAEQRIKSLKMIEDGRFEAELWKEDKLHQESELRKEAELWRPEVNTKKSWESSGTGASKEEESLNKDNKDDGNEGMKKSREEINEPDKDT